MGEGEQMKKVILSSIALVLILPIVFVFSACGKDDGENVVETTLSLAEWNEYLETISSELFSSAMKIEMTTTDSEKTMNVTIFISRNGKYYANLTMAASGEVLKYYAYYNGAHTYYIMNYDGENYPDIAEDEDMFGYSGLYDSFESDDDDDDDFPTTSIVKRVSGDTTTIIAKGSQAKSGVLTSRELIYKVDKDLKVFEMGMTETEKSGSETSTIKMTMLPFSGTVYSQLPTDLKNYIESD